MKGLIRWWVAAGLLGLIGTSVLASGRRPPDLVMVVIPARYTVVQVAQDLARRHRAVVVSYEGQVATAEPRLQVWDGAAWHSVAFADYRDAIFLRETPREVLLFGEEQELPTSLIAASSWAEHVWQIPGVQTADMVNAFGKVLRFDRNEWTWWTLRYKLDLDDANLGQRKDSWYYHPYVEVTPPRTGPSDPVISAQGVVVPTEPAPVSVEMPPPAVPPAAPGVPVPGAAEPEGFSEEAIAE